MRRQNHLIILLIVLVAIPIISYGSYWIIQKFKLSGNSDVYEIVMDFTSKDFYSQVQNNLHENSSPHIIAVSAGHKPGFLIFGPYRRLKKGKYVAKMSLKLSSEAIIKETICEADIFAERLYGKREVKLGNKTQDELDVYILFEVSGSDENKKFEFRLFCNGKAAVQVNRALVAIKVKLPENKI